MQQPRRSFFCRLNAFAQGVFLTTILIVVAAFSIWLYLQSRIHEEIRHEIERRFAEHYSGYRVSVRQARLREGRGIEIYGLQIATADGAERLAYVEEVFAACPVKMEDLLCGAKPPARQVWMRGLKLWTRQQDDGSWDLARLWPPPRLSTCAPPLLIRDAELEAVVAHGRTPRRVTFRQLQLDVIPGEPGSGNAAPDARAAGGMEVRAVAKGDHFETLRLQAQLQPLGGGFQAWGSLEGLRFSTDLLDLLPSAWREQTAGIEMVGGRTDLHFRVSGDAQNLLARYVVEGSLSGGQLADRRLPYRFHGVKSDFYCDEQRLVVKQLTARTGNSSLQMSLERRGWDESSPLAIHARAWQLALDGRVVECLPKDLQASWRKYFPAGTINADVQLRFDGQRWQAAGEVDCLDVSFAYHKFPYRLERSQGKLSLQNNELTIQLEALAGGQKVTLNGQVQNPGPAATGWVEVVCKQPIAVDEKLLAAVADPRAQEVIRSLQPSGTLAFAGRFERLHPGQAQIRRYLKIELHNCALRYDKFPYPLGMIRGTVIWDEEGWSFQKLSGQNDSGYIECEGSWTPTADGGSKLALNFVGADVPLEEELRDALKPDLRRIWNDLRPRGTLDYLAMQLRYASAQKDLSLTIRAQNWKKKPDDSGRSITVQPVWFPYRLDNATGLVVYRDGKVYLQGVSATHDETRLTIDGRCELNPQGEWNVELTNVVADELRFDRELLAALPRGLGKAVERLHPRGNLSLQGALALRGQAGSSQPPLATWDMTVDVEHGAVNCGLPLDHIHGDIRLTGSGDATNFITRGELNLDSLVYRDLQCTQVRGPLRIEPNGAILGVESERDRLDGPPRSLTALCVGGEFSLDGVVRFDGDVPFEIRAQLDRGDLAQFAREMALRNQNIRGRANALVNLSGNAQSRHTWGGSGFVRLYEADIYEIPVMLALLKVLSIRRPDRTGFTSSDIDFRIQGEHVYFDRINFNGDAVSLKGRGELALDRQIDLEFYTLVGRREFEPPALRALLQQASSQMLLIHVTGTLDQPHLTREALPMIKETLQQMFPEAAERRQLARLPPLDPSEEISRRLRMLRR